MSQVQHWEFWNRSTIENDVFCVMEHLLKCVESSAQPPRLHFKNQDRHHAVGFSCEEIGTENLPLHEDDPTLSGTDNAETDKAQQNEVSAQEGLMLDTNLTSKLPESPSGMELAWINSYEPDFEASLKGFKGKYVYRQTGCDVSGHVDGQIKDVHDELRAVAASGNFDKVLDVTDEAEASDDQLGKIHVQFHRNVDHPGELDDEIENRDGKVTQAKVPERNMDGSDGYVDENVKVVEFEVRNVCSDDIVDKQTVGKFGDIDDEQVMIMDSQHELFENSGNELQDVMITDSQHELFKNSGNEFKDVGAYGYRDIPFENEVGETCVMNRDRKNLDFTGKTSSDADDKFEQHSLNQNEPGHQSRDSSDIMTVVRTSTELFPLNSEAETNSQPMKLTPESQKDQTHDVKAASGQQSPYTEQRDTAPITLQPIESLVDQEEAPSGNLCISDSNYLKAHFPDASISEDDQADFKRQFFHDENGKDSQQTSKILFEPSIYRATGNTSASIVEFPERNIYKEITSYTGSIGMKGAEILQVSKNLEAYEKVVLGSPFQLSGASITVSTGSDSNIQLDHNYDLNTDEVLDKLTVYEPKGNPVAVYHEDSRDDGQMNYSTSAAGHHSEDSRDDGQMNYSTSAASHRSEDSRDDRQMNYSSSAADDRIEDVASCDDLNKCSDTYSVSSASLPALQTQIFDQKVPTVVNNDACASADGLSHFDLGASTSVCAGDEPDKISREMQIPASPETACSTSGSAELSSNYVIVQSQTNDMVQKILSFSQEGCLPYQNLDKHDILTAADHGCLLYQNLDKYEVLIAADDGCVPHQNLDKCEVIAVDGENHHSSASKQEQEVIDRGLLPDCGSYKVDRSLDERFTTKSQNQTNEQQVPDNMEAELQPLDQFGQDGFIMYSCDADMHEGIGAPVCQTVQEYKSSQSSQESSQESQESSQESQTDTFDVLADGLCTTLCNKRTRDGKLVTQKCFQQKDFDPGRSVFHAPPSCSRPRQVGLSRRVSLPPLHSHFKVPRQK